MGKSQIIRRIHKAATEYQKFFLGKTYLFVYENQYVEVMFKKSSFLHLTGVDTKLSAKNFFEHAIKANGLRPVEISFSKEHPYVLADKKTQILADLKKIVSTDVMIATDITTATFTYSLGITDLQMVVCLSNDTDKTGKVLTRYKIPYSFRVEEIQNSKYNSLYEVTHIFRAAANSNKYNELTFGDRNTINKLPEEIQKKIELPEKKKVVIKNIKNKPRTPRL